MSNEAGKQEEAIINLLSHALSLQREGLLGPETLRQIDGRIRILNEQMRAEGVNVLIRGLDHTGHPLLDPTDLPDEIDRKLDRYERMIYNYLLKVKGTTVDVQMLVRVLENADSQFGKHTDKIKVVIDTLFALRAITKDSSCVHQVVREEVAVGKTKYTYYCLLEKSDVKDKSN